ncbi:serine hydrolase domain-containing protein [Streptomyces luteireticuli]|uniref:Serine hydrolase domain-containing protein n=1 Tax=Streptomyces luteireticuli TaxID=173858 RepID=A0ABN0Z6P7_9ACTN
MRTGVVRAAAAALSSVVLMAAGAADATAGGNHRASGARMPAPDMAAVRTALGRTVGAGAPGAFAVIRDGGATTAARTATIGKADLNGTPMNASWRFRAGSNTKMFTAALVLRLAERNRIKLDRPMRDYLPPGTLPKGWTMTVRQVMQHRAGIYDHTYDLLGGPGEETTSAFEKRVRNTVYRPGQLAALSVKHGVQYPPGTRYAYSNTDYVLLGMAIEHVTHRPYADVLREQILRPLRLTGTSFVVPTRTIAGPHITGYLTNDNHSRPPLNATEQTASWIWSAGAVISSAADMDRFLGALLGGRLLSAASLRQMTSVLPTSTPRVAYGLGIREITLSCGKVYGHSGVVQGYQSEVFATRDGKRTVVAFANASNNGAVLRGLLSTLEPAFCGAAAPKPPPRRGRPAALGPIPVIGDIRV